MTRALRDGRPAHANFQIKSAQGEEHSIEASALPISGTQDDDRSGAIIVFWPDGKTG